MLTVRTMTSIKMCTCKSCPSDGKCKIESIVCLEGLPAMTYYRIYRGRVLDEMSQSGEIFQVAKVLLQCHAIGVCLGNEG